MLDDVRRYWVGFHLVPGIGSARLGQLIERFGSAEAAWRATERDLAASGMSAGIIAALIGERARIDLDREMEKIERAGARAITLEDAEYPRLLKQISSPPPVLYVRGELTPADDLAVGMVGTRRSTSYGNDMARRIARDLAESSVTVVSGLAIGVDSASHRAALEAGGRTIAVLGCGVDQVYPPRNRQLAQDILTQGALVSEYAIGTTPLGQNFPARNRIISGLSRGVVVVEAPLRSGALITATFAADQGREVWAVPGSALSASSAGCHMLIRDGATLVSSAAEVLEQLDVAAVQAHTQTRMLLPETPAERILFALVGAEPRHMDELCHESGLAIHETSGTLLAMELKGLVRQQGAQYYVRA